MGNDICVDDAASLRGLFLAVAVAVANELKKLRKIKIKIV